MWPAIVCTEILPAALCSWRRALACSTINTIRKSAFLTSVFEFQGVTASRYGCLGNRPRTFHAPRFRRACAIHFCGDVQAEVAIQVFTHI